MRLAHAHVVRPIISALVGSSALILPNVKVVTRETARRTANGCPGIYIGVLSPDAEQTRNLEGRDSASPIAPAHSGRDPNLRVAFDVASIAVRTTRSSPPRVLVCSGDVWRHVTNTSRYSRDVFPSPAVFAEHAHVHVKRSARGIIFWLSGPKISRKMVSIREKRDCTPTRSRSCRVIGQADPSPRSEVSCPSLSSQNNLSSRCYGVFHVERQPRRPGRRSDAKLRLDTFPAVPQL